MRSSGTSRRKSPPAKKVRPTTRKRTHSKTGKRRVSNKIDYDCPEANSFYENNQEIVERDNPNFTKRQIKQVLRKMWKNSVERQIYLLEAADRHIAYLQDEQERLAAEQERLADELDVGPNPTTLKYYRLTRAQYIKKHRYFVRCNSPDIKNAKDIDAIVKHMWKDSIVRKKALRIQIYDGNIEDSDASDTEERQSIVIKTEK